MDGQNTGARIMEQRAYDWFLKKSIEGAMQNAPRDADIQSERSLAVEEDVGRLWKDQATREDILQMYSRQRPEENKAELISLREKYGIPSR